MKEPCHWRGAIINKQDLNDHEDDPRRPGMTGFPATKPSTSCTHESNGK